MRDVMTGPDSATLRIVPTTSADLDRILSIEERSFSAPWTRKMFEVEVAGNQFGHVWSAWVHGATARSRCQLAELEQAGGLVHGGVGAPDALQRIRPTRSSCSVQNDEHLAPSKLGGAPPPGPHDATEIGPETLVGYICFWMVFEEFRLMTLAVDGPWRRRGIAKRLLTEALTWARAAGAHRAFLEVRASNAAAIQLYEQTGFRTMAVRSRYYTNPVEDALIMAMEPIR